MNNSPRRRRLTKFTALRLLVLLSLGGLIAFGFDRASSTCHVTYIPVEENWYLNDAGLKVEQFKLHAPRNTKIKVWIETYQKGKLIEDLSVGYQYVPEREEILENKIRFSTYKPPVPVKSKPHQVKWTLGIGGSSIPRWADDPFEKTDISIHHFPDPQQKLELGKTELILVYSGGIASDKKPGVRYFSNSDFEQHDVSMLLKCRIEKIDSERDSPGSRTSGFTREVFPE